MGKIFGISDLPVSTIDKAIDFYGQRIPKVHFESPKFEDTADTFISKTRKQPSNFIKMRNGFGKLLSHFSKKITNIQA